LPIHFSPPACIITEESPDRFASFAFIGKYRKSITGDSTFFDLTCLLPRRLQHSRIFYKIIKWNTHRGAVVISGNAAPDATAAIRPNGKPSRDRPTCRRDPRRLSARPLRASLARPACRCDASHDHRACRHDATLACGKRVREEDSSIHKLFTKIFCKHLDASFGEAVILFLEVK